MMDSGSVRNMYRTLSNKCEKQCISLAFIIRIHHDARSSECQKSETYPVELCDCSTLSECEGHDIHVNDYASVRTG